MALQWISIQVVFGSLRKRQNARIPLPGWRPLNGSLAFADDKNLARADLLDHSDRSVVCTHSISVVFDLDRAVSLLLSHSELAAVDLSVRSFISRIDSVVDAGFVAAGRSLSETAVLPLLCDAGHSFST